MTEAARLLRHARRRAGLTQRALAAKAGVPQPYVARVESSRTDPSVTSLSRLLRACDATLEAVPGTAAGDRDAIRAALATPPADRLPANIVDALRALHDGYVAYVVVGAAAAALHGAPGPVEALDVCPDPDTTGAPPDGVRVVATPPGTAGYADLAAGAVPVEGAGLRVRVAALDDLIRTARAAGDDAAAGLLLAVRDETAAP